MISIGDDGTFKRVHVIGRTTQPCATLFDLDDASKRTGGARDVTVQLDPVPDDDALASQDACFGRSDCDTVVEETAVPAPIDGNNQSIRGIRVIGAVFGAWAAAFSGTFEGRMVILPACHQAATKQFQSFGKSGMVFETQETSSTVVPGLVNAMIAAKCTMRWSA